MKQLGLFFSFYARPLRTMARLLDEGSPLFGALLVLLVSSLFEFGPLLGLTQAAEDSDRPPVSVAGSSSTAEDVNAEELDDEPTSVGLRGASVGALASIATSGPIGTLVGLAVLYAPSLLFAATLLAPIGGFGVAFRRDFGGLLTATFFIWAAAHLPFAVAAAFVPQSFLLRLAGTVAFAALLTPAAQLALGAPLLASGASVLVGFFGLLLMPFLTFLASPFLLFYAWAFISGNLSDVEWSLKARRSQRRYLEAATLNPRDAEAHIQLGLIHLRRRQWPEARARFERAVEIDPTDPDARYQLGRLERRDGKYAAAEKHFLAVIARDPKFSQHEIWREFGANYLDAKLYEDARKALEHFAGQRAHDPEGLVYLAESLAALQRNDDAQTRFQEAIAAADSTPHYRQHEVKPWRKRAARQLRS